MADNRKLAAGLRNLPASAREDLAGREQDIQRGKTVELLRRAGKEMYDNPIVNTAIGFTPVLGDIQAAGETMAALNRGAPWQETAGYAAGMLPFMPMIGKTVWHGSPHSFEKFDLSKIGTGEGAQAYGHGLYLAEARPTAEEYAVNLANRDIANQGRLNAHANAQRLVNLAGDPKYAADDIRFALESNPEHPQKQLLQDTLQHLESGSYANPLKNTGSLYKVDLPDEQIAKMLDLDKPLSEQPEIQQAFVNHLVENQRLSPERASDFLKDKTAGEAYGTLSGRNNQEIISQSLLERGIPGIQYLDQASRGAGDGTRNYVVFSDEIPQILERNGQPVAQALRNYEAPKQALDVTKQDASDIFGEGASRIRYQDPNTQGFIDVLQKPDGTASVLGLEVPEAARGKGIGQSLQQQVLSDFPEMQGQVSSKAAATTAHRIGRRPVGNPEATLDDVFRMIDEDSSVNLVSPEMQKRFNFGG